MASCPTVPQFDKPPRSVKQITNVKYKNSALKSSNVYAMKVFPSIDIKGNIRCAAGLGTSDTLKGLVAVGRHPHFNVVKLIESFTSGLCPSFDWSVAINSYYE